MQNKGAKILFALICLLCVAAMVLSVWLYTGYVSPEEAAAVQEADRLQQELLQAQRRISELDGEVSAGELHAAELESAIQSGTEEISALKKKISVLIAEGNASDEYQEILLEEIAQLQQEKQENTDKLAELTELIENYENITTLNFGFQAKKISDLLLLVAEPNRPCRTLIRTVTNEETGETEEISEEVPAQLAFFYRDLTTGYTLSYNSDEVMYSASLIKVPYILSLLESIAEFEENKLRFDADGNPLYDEDGNPLFEGNHPNLDENGRIVYLPGEEKYDLSRVWVYDKDTMMVEGSGKLKECDSGLQLTWLELIQYALQYSDNIAFAQLRMEFGYAGYYQTARRLGIQGASSGFMQLSAADCGKFMEELSSFIQTNDTYGPFVREALLNSNYPVLIPYAVSPTPAAHKYGWDSESYHDMAIVYDEHPYILVIMTDLDEGGNTANSYIQSIIRSIHGIHKNFYAGK